MDDLKFITASNIINLRTQAGMTQTELGNLLSYSDKSVSKWERAEAVPDAYVLKKLSEIFGVTVDDLLSSHSEWKPVEEESVTVWPHVQPGARYELTCMDPEARRTATAEEMAAGFALTAPKRGGVVWFYRKIEE